MLKDIVGWSLMALWLAFIYIVKKANQKTEEWQWHTSQLT